MGAQHASRWGSEVVAVDRAVYGAVAGTPTPGLDAALRRLSEAANYSRLSISAAAGLALFGGRSGRRAAVTGLTSVAVTSAVMNLAVKPLVRRPRPERGELVLEARRVPMPTSASFPSGHSAAAFAFATGVGHVLPWTAVPLRALGALVAYSRVHTGVHFPGDVVAGSLLGGAIAQVTARAIDRRGERRALGGGAYVDKLAAANRLCAPKRRSGA
jgi:membrane-associated phospholipid phosphatase